LHFLAIGQSYECVPKQRSSEFMHTEQFVSGGGLGAMMPYPSSLLAGRALWSSAISASECRTRRLSQNGYGTILILFEQTHYTIFNFFR